MIRMPLPVVVGYLKLVGRRRRLESPADLRARIAEERRANDGSPPHRMPDSVTISVETIEGSASYTVSPRGRASGVHVVYLHGGAHVSQISSHQWLLIGELVSRSGATAHVPIHPLAPDHDYRAAHSMVFEVYRRLAEHVDGSDLVLMGDSSGGGLALAVAQQLTERGLPQPRDIVLIAPWLDLAVSHPDVPELARRDPWLDVPGLAEAGRLWAGDQDVSHPHVSPIHGSLRGLGRLTIFIGGRDLLLSDARRIRALADDEGADLTWIEEPDMIHVWPVLPIRQAGPARDTIVGILARG